MLLSSMHRRQSARPQRPTIGSRTPPPHHPRLSSNSPSSAATFLLPSENIRSPSTLFIKESSLSRQQLICLRHKPMKLKVSDVDVNGSVLSMQMNLSDGCGPLRRDWRDNPPLSPLAQLILQQQSNSSLPVVSWEMFYLSGIGANMALWSRFMCYAWEHDMRLRSYNSGWLWVDKSYCNLRESKHSPWLCYFPKLEYLCTQPQTRSQEVFANVSNLRRTMLKKACQHDHQPGFLPAFRSATVEYFFRAVSPLVIQEAQRQIGVVFGPNGAPKDLITVHVRWGDKSNEMKLVPIETYVNAVWQLLKDDDDKNKSNNNSTNNVAANIYLLTEDPLAADAFVQAAPKRWKIYIDVSIKELTPFRPPCTLLHCASFMARNTRGRGGLVHLGSLLVGMEANDYVLSTESTFGRVIEAIRTNILDPRCDNCTRLIDVQLGDWK